MDITASESETAERKNPLSRLQAAHLWPGLTAKERELLDSLLVPGVNNVKEAADRIGIKPNHAYQLLLRLKMRYVTAKGVKEEVDTYRAMLKRKGLEKVLKD